MLDELLQPDQHGRRRNQFLTFFLGQEEYGIDILRVQEIKGWNGATAIPNTPDYILGVINLRGIIVPIIDLRLRFGLPEARYDAMTVVIVVKTRGEDDQERTVGLVVDAVSEVYDLSEKTMNPPPELGCSVETDFIEAIANLEDKMIIVMNVDKLVSREVREQAKKAVQAAGAS
ncbi:MAG: chemotaxis protein CheW [Gammaproteobacteria bacterium]|nr:MAG: chemotaxis protein CheW [Gammaproteobacteria bacterium]